MCLAQHHRDPLPCLARTPNSSPRRCLPTEGWVSLQPSPLPSHPSVPLPSSLLTHQLLPGIGPDARVLRDDPQRVTGRDLVGGRIEKDCGEKPGEGRHGDLRSSGLRREAQDENVSQAV